MINLRGVLFMFLYAISPSIPKILPISPLFLFLSLPFLISFEFFIASTAGILLAFSAGKIIERKIVTATTTAEMRIASQ